VKPTVRFAALALITVIGLNACGGDSGETAGSGSAASADFPMTVSSCGENVTIAEPVERVVTLDASAVTLLHAAGGLDKLVHRFELEADVYPPGIAQALEGINRTQYERSELSKEAVLATDPDLIIGSPQPGMNTQSMNALGIAFVVPSGICGGTQFGETTGDGTEDFDDLFKDIETYGRVLGIEDRAKTSVDDLRARIAAVSSRAEAAADKPRTAGVVNITPGFPVGAYGTGSMSHTQLEALGIRNVFSDHTERIFDASSEAVIDRAPDVLIVLVFDQSAEEAKNGLLSLPGVSDMAAVRNDKILILDYYYSAASTLAVDGLEDLAEQLGL
jgi:iron complex transport system substrate-binding protein